MIKIIEENILNASENVICQQVNCQGVMGSGLAKQIRDKYPNVYFDYQEYLRINGKVSSLGQYQIIEIGKDKYIANLFGQFNYGKEKRHTDYGSLAQALSSVKVSCKDNNKSIAIPYGIGCGLAGGDWNIVYKIIENVFEDYDVTIYWLITK